MEILSGVQLQASFSRERDLLLYENKIIDNERIVILLVHKFRLQKLVACRQVHADQVLLHNKICNTIQINLPLYLIHNRIRKCFRN